MPTVAEVIADLDNFAPPALAADWDNVGLLLGDPAAHVDRILTCLTLTPDVAAEAVETGCQLVVTHHPILFRGAKRLTTGTAEGRTVLALAKAGVAVYSPHTAFDNTRGGINDRLAGRVGLMDVQPLRTGNGPRSCKVVVFVPDADFAKVSDAMFAAGGGVIGEYRECSFRLAGMGTFFGNDSANPTVGQKGRREEVPEWRLEVVCPESIVDRVLAAMRSAHSYEEPAYDVYPLRPARSPIGEGRVGRLAVAVPLAGMGTFFGNDSANPTVGQKGRREEVPEWRLEVVCPETIVDRVLAAMRSAHSYEEPAYDVYPLRPARSPIGEGRVGRLAVAVPLAEFATRVRSALRCGPVQIVGDGKRTVERIAIACGAAGEFLTDAVHARAEVFLTGEMRFHDWLAAEAQGIGLVLPGHYASERFAVEDLADKLRRRWPGTEVSASQRERDPVTWA